ncbi:MAG: hypothetical protein JXJ04_26085 [Spirochaetales bacterium]|nr:hypothetical protein [Spirochaetales bacterium]
MKMINRFSIFIIIILVLSSCGIFGSKGAAPQPVNPYDDFPPIFPSLDEKPEEVTPEPNSDPKPTATPKKVTTIKARILEYNKATKVVYINVGSSTKGIVGGLDGKIYNDKALTQENGSVKLTKVYPSYAEGLASNQNYEIDPKAAIAVFTIDQ